MTTHYQLSRTQRKELYERGRPLAIALPLSGQATDDPLRLARELLPEIDGAAGERITVAEVATVLVSPSKARDRETLTHLLGPILEDRALRQWAATHEVLIVEIVPRRPRGEMLPLQWPRSAVVDGVTIPQPDTET